MRRLIVSLLLGSLLSSCVGVGIKDLPRLKKELDVSNRTINIRDMGKLVVVCKYSNGILGSSSQGPLNDDTKDSIINSVGVYLYDLETKGKYEGAGATVKPWSPTLTATECEEDMEDELSRIDIPRLYFVQLTNRGWFEDIIVGKDLGFN